MAKGELFENLREYRTALSQQERETAVKGLIQNARIAGKYFYSLKETCAILHCSRDELQTILHQFRLDAVLFLGVYRIPWYDLAGFILDDHDDTLQEDLNEYLQEIIRRNRSLPGINAD
ncbi:hypothetical protein [Treponema denticola]|uniref:Uncharacterized protein n=1 Tax=Treponema denticola SP33 TaxID=999437 RepID=M2AS71_TREDN|nr:hypothetical protein [Treponema denticola]EMB19920.1 hypothetical protein HMPREF9733_02599 [Treponema denticola SP33]EMB22900.1 hypothetical protein HMPREF9733_01723 [Treponema denticola SP33]EPF38049.1 hypothetical protein HMPREF9732_00013 [Treponema denticola SP32]UTC81744.1 hypothetical protein HGJ18_00430 [Treponema denticola]